MNSHARKSGPAIHDSWRKVAIPRLSGLVMILVAFANAGPKLMADGKFGGSTIAACPAHFVVSLCDDKAGNIWVGTEGHGVYRFNPNQISQSPWTQFTTGKGLDDSTVEALACDSRGRIWAGTLNHGVAVFNGKYWQRYGLLTDKRRDERAGPIGEHVFSIKVSSLDGSIWICTNSGISRYEIGGKSGKDKIVGQWIYYTVTGGLPSDDIWKVAFGPHGRVYAATGCDGLAISRPIPKDREALRHHKLNGPIRYGRWKIVKSGFVEAPPLTPRGNGLPGNLLNDLLVTPDGTAWVATDDGIAWSANGGRRWSFLRGEDWLAKDQGLTHPPSPSYLFNASRRAVRTQLLSEDYCTCLAADSTGRIWVGHRRTGIDIINPASGHVYSLQRDLTGARNKSPHREWKQPHFYVDSTLMRGHGPPILGCYGGGVLELPSWFAGATRAAKLDGFLTEGKSTPENRSPPMPTAATTPTLAQIAVEEKNIDLVAGKLWNHKDVPRVVRLDDDWRTQGNWLGRYGTYYARLGAMDSPRDFSWGTCFQPPPGGVSLGGHFRHGDFLRYWVTWLYTADGRSLEMPKPMFRRDWMKGRVSNKTLCRRQSEWDDHGEAYPAAWQGPGLRINLRVPSGYYELCLYDVNKDGHAAGNRYRDYSVTVTRGVNPLRSGAEGRLRLPILADARISDFWNGLWTRFLVRGPGWIQVQIHRGSSMNTILAGYFIGVYRADPTPYSRAYPNSKNTVGNPQAASIYILHRPDFGKARGNSTVHHRVSPMEMLTQRKLARIATRGWATDWSAESLRYSSFVDRVTKARTPQGYLLRQSHLARRFWQLHRFRRTENLFSSAGRNVPRAIEENLRFDPSLGNPSYRELLIFQKTIRYDTQAPDR